MHKDWADEQAWNRRGMFSPFTQCVIFVVAITAGIVVFPLLNLSLWIEVPLSIVVVIGIIAAAALLLPRLLGMNSIDPNSVALGDNIVRNNLIYQKHFSDAFDAFNNPHKHPQTAVQIFQKHAENDDPDAQHNLGILYETGVGVYSKDEDTATYWYRKAAENSLAAAQWQLAVKLAADPMSNPDGFDSSEKDKRFVEAYKWLLHADNNKYGEEAKEGLRRLREHMTAEQKERAESEFHEDEPREDVRQQLHSLTEEILGEPPETDAERDQRHRRLLLEISKTVKEELPYSEDAQTILHEPNGALRYRIEDRHENTELFCRGSEANLKELDEWKHLAKVCEKENLKVWLERDFESTIDSQEELGVHRLAPTLYPVDIVIARAPDSNIGGNMS